MAYHLILIALSMATSALGEGHCATADPLHAPFPDAACLDITKPNGTAGTLYMSDRFTPLTPKTCQASPGTHCAALDTIFSGKSTNPYAPLAADCAAIKDWLLTHAGSWNVTASDAREAKWTGLAAVDTCAFVVGVAGGRDAFAELVLDQVDVGNLILYALERYQVEDRLDVLGRTACSALDEEGGRVDVDVDWRIVDPEMVDIGPEGTPVKE